MVYGDGSNGMTLTADFLEKRYRSGGRTSVIPCSDKPSDKCHAQHNPKGNKYSHCLLIGSWSGLYVLVAFLESNSSKQILASICLIPLCCGTKMLGKRMGGADLDFPSCQKSWSGHGWDLKLVHSDRFSIMQKQLGFAKTFVIRMENTGMYSVHLPK